MQTLDYHSFLRRNSEQVQEPELNTWLKFLPRPTIHGPWIAGGAVRRMIADGGKLGDGDIDYFFRDDRQHYDFCEALKANQSIKIENEKKNENNIQFSVTIPNTPQKVSVQAINFSYFENPEQLINQFDFTVCQFAFDGVALYCGDFALWDLARKRIVINNVRFPVATIRHLIKYSKQGFFACGGALTELTRRIVAAGPSAIDDKFKYID